MGESNNRGLLEFTLQRVFTADLVNGKFEFSNKAEYNWKLSFSRSGG